MPYFGSKQTDAPKRTTKSPPYAVNSVRDLHKYSRGDNNDLKGRNESNDAGKRLFLIFFSSILKSPLFCLGVSSRQSTLYFIYNHLACLELLSPVRLDDILHHRGITMNHFFIHAQLIMPGYPALAQLQYKHN